MLAQFHLLLSALRLKIACFSFFLSFFQRNEKKERENSQRVGRIDSANSKQQPNNQFYASNVPQCRAFLLRVIPRLAGKICFFSFPKKEKLKRKNVSWKICSSINGSRGLDFSQEIEFSVNATIRETPRYRSNVSRLTRS